MTSGPGAILDMRADGAPISGVHSGLEEWDSEAPLEGVLENQKIIERRLCYKLGRRYFRLPPVVGETGLPWQKSYSRNYALVIRRFPEWLQCPTCSYIKRATTWSQEPGRAYRYCATCTDKRPGIQKVFVVPVRFVTACINGHLDDFPWHFWVKHKSTCNKEKRDLKLYSRGPGLAGLNVQCLGCGAKKSMENAFKKAALIGLRCQGRRPWLGKDEDCDLTGDSGLYRVMQRGASNLYYPVFESALDIPPWSEPVQVILNDRWDDLCAIEDSLERLNYIKRTKSIMDAAVRVGLSAGQVAQAFEELQQIARVLSPDEIRLDEFKIFSTSPRTMHQEFESHLIKTAQSFEKYLGAVSRVARLREVRVMRGFTRIRPPAEGDSARIAAISTEKLDWLPAIEVRGEGIFISLNEETLHAWENSQKVLSRAKEVDHRFAESWKEFNPDTPLPFRITPRRLLIHSFSHLMIRQLTFECGYAAASLRERIYINDEENGMCGVLIYTGTSDSDGTLGGLQTRAEATLIELSIKMAIYNARWCSSDPLCIHGDLASPESNSLSSCHSCLLLPETSCEWHNAFLDRGMVIGSPENPEIGFFSTLIEN